MVSTPVTDDPIAPAVAAVDRDAARQAYLDQGRMLFLDPFLEPSLLHPLQEEMTTLRGALHRNYIPRHKKGGSVSYYTLCKRAPAILALYHAVTPLGEGEERVMLTLQYVTDPRMGPFHRFVSNMKDAIAYFGLPALVRRHSGA